MNVRGTTVPDAYLGVWKRTLLRTPTIEDTTSTVYWLQTLRWHADIRIPADRPGCTGKRTLGELTRGELLGLARQQGFAGITTVAGQICRWHRRVDFQPPAAHADVGRMTFETPDRILEYGVEQDYFEIWERVPDSVGVTAALEGDRLPGPLWLLRSGGFAMRIRPRLAALPRAASLLALAADADEATLRTWLDFELSFARIGPDGTYRIEHSTLPWLEGGRIEEVEALLVTGDGGLVQSARHWQRLE